MPKGKNTKERIKDEALNLFSQYGFAGGSVRDIGKKAGVRESALYNYFPSKKEILNELIKDAKKYSVGVELLTDELLDRLNKPKVFIENFVKILLKEWDSEKQKKYLKLVLIEQFRSEHLQSEHLQGEYLQSVDENKISINLLIDETIKIWEMIFTQMLNYRFIKKHDPNILAREFVYPLFMLRLQHLTTEKTDWKLLNKKSEEHINYFWTSIKK
ncbi:MAG: TetR/AcrR family transcriptional regulator [Melioribacteraceae bacterium]|nr:TetR/AcrR family transcriptional regulator [Melioribacteraceae bacterium]